MKSKFLSLFIFSLLLAAAWLFLPSLSSLNEYEFDQPEEENAEMLAHEKQILADPATGEIPQGITFKNIDFLHELQRYQKEVRGASWNSRGPWNVGGRTRALCIDVTNENHILAGAVSGGIWQSNDGGISWTRVSSVNGHPGVVSITQDTRPGKTNIWYALSGEMYGTSAGSTGAFYLGDGAFKSLDNGTTWTPITTTTAGAPGGLTSVFQTGWRIASSPVDSVATCIYMANYGSILRSIDTGKTWKNVLGNNFGSYFTDVKVSKTGIVYAALSSEGVSKGFFRSGDGIHFTKITPANLKNYNRTVIEINPNNEHEVFFLSLLTADSSGGVSTANYEGTKEYVALYKYHYLSGDGSGTGGEWTNLSMNLPVNASSPFDRFNCQGGYDLMITMQPGSNTLVIGGTNLYRSTDAFSTSSNITEIGGYEIGTTLPFFGVYPNHHPDQHDFIFLKSDPKKAYSISDGGIKFTEDVTANPVVWSNRSYGYVTSQFYSIAIDEVNAGDPWILGGLQDNGNYITNTNNLRHDWVMPVNGDGAFDYISPDKSFYVMSIQQGRIVKVTLDKHGYLLARRRIDPAGFDKKDYDFINPLLVDPNDNNVMYLPIGKKLARLNNLATLSVNNNYNQLANAWTVLSDTITTAALNASTPARISTLAVSKSAPNIVYLGTNNREMYRIDNANTGNPKMIKLDTTTIKKLPAGGNVEGIAVDPDSAKNILICYSNYGINSLFYSNDSGYNWFYVGGNLEGASNPSGGDPSIRCVNILVDQTGKRTYFAGTSIGLFSTDTLILSPIAGATNTTKWAQEGVDKIGAAVVSSIKIRQVDGYVAIGTHGNGVFESYYTGKVAPPVNQTYTSVTCYPNPASDKIYFSFDAMNTRNFRTEVYDISGRRIESLSNGINNNNISTQVLDVSHYATGHYFITFYTADNKKQMQHFIVKH